MMTRHAAYALFRETEVGSLEPGMYADLIVLSADPLSVESEAIPSIQVQLTMVGGRVEHCAEIQTAICP
jgi:predicted amidohydrolase YtcJ